MTVQYYSPADAQATADATGEPQIAFDGVTSFVVYPGGGGTATTGEVAAVPTAPATTSGSAATSGFAENAEERQRRYLVADPNFWQSPDEYWQDFEGRSGTVAGQGHNSPWWQGQGWYEGQQYVGNDPWAEQDVSEAPTGALLGHGMIANTPGSGHWGADEFGNPEWVDTSTTKYDITKGATGFWNYDPFANTRFAFEGSADLIPAELRAYMESTYGRPLYEYQAYLNQTAPEEMGMDPMGGGWYKQQGTPLDALKDLTALKARIGAEGDPYAEAYFKAMQQLQDKLLEAQRKLDREEGRATDKAAAIGIASLGLGGFAAPALSSMLAPTLGELGAQIAAGALLGGAKGALTGDPLKGALTGGLGSAAGGMLGGEFDPNSLDLSMSPELGGLAEQTGLSGFDFAGPTAEQLAELGFSMDPSELAALDPAVAAKYTGAMDANLDTDLGILTSPDFEMFTDPGFQGFADGAGATAGLLGDQGLDGYTSEQVEGTTPPAAPESGISPQQAIKYAQQAQKLYGIVKQFLGNDGQTALPERRQGQSDAEYYEQIAVEYLGLDADAMEKAGLEPGTPEYLEYILEQADAIIEQIMGGAEWEGMSPEELQAAFRDKTADEMEQLARALTVRGQIGQSVYAESGTDPFTGETEEFAPGFHGQRDVGAAHRGRAREVETLAGLRGDEAQSYLSGLLGRNTDLFGMQAARDAAWLRAALAETQDEDERKRGEGIEFDVAAPYAQDYWQQVLESRDSRALERLLGQIGDEGRQGAAVESLFGWRK